MSSRMRLRHENGRVYLNRWGWECKFFGIFLHHMDAPDPGEALHDHPWSFTSLILKGGYLEYRNATRHEETVGGQVPLIVRRKPWSVRSMRLDECHRICQLDKPGGSWSIILHGPKRRTWGFYTKDGWVAGQDYWTEERALWNDLAE